MSTDPPAAVGRCLSCDYPLRDLTTPRCPECGRAFNPTDPSTMNLSGRPVVRGLTRWLLRPVGWWTVVAALALTAGLYWFTWVPVVGHEVREYLARPAYWPFVGDGSGWAPAELWTRSRRWWDDGLQYRSARNACVITWAAGLLTLWVLGWAALALAIAWRRTQVREVLHAQWRRWACLTVIGGLFWAGLRYDVAFRLVAWGHGPAFDRLAADVTSGPLLFRYPDRRVGWFDATDIYVKGDTVGFRALVDAGERRLQGEDPAALTPVWIRIKTDRVSGGPAYGPDDDDDGPVDLNAPGFGGEWPSKFPTLAKHGRVGFSDPARRVSLGKEWRDDPPVAALRARDGLAAWLADCQDPDPRTVQDLVRLLQHSPWDPANARKAQGGTSVFGPPATDPLTEPGPDDPRPLVLNTRPDWQRSGVVFVRPDIEALADLGAKAVPALAEALDPAQPAWASDAAWILASMGPKAAAAEGQLAALLSHPDLRLAQDAMIALTRIETVTAASLPALVQAVDSPDPALRQAAMQNLRFAQVDASVLLPIFRKGLVHPDRNVRVRAATGLWQLGPKAADAVPDLHAALLAVDAAAAAQPDRSPKALAIDEGLRMVCASAIVRAKPDDAAGRVTLARSARRVLVKLAEPNGGLPGVAEPGDPELELFDVPIEALVILQATSDDRRGWNYEGYIGAVLQRCDPNHPVLDVRDLRIAAATWRRELRPDVEPRLAYDLACGEAARVLASHRQAAFRQVVTQLPPAVAAPKPIEGAPDIVAVRRSAELRSLRLDVLDTNLERSVDERIASVEALFALARTREELGDIPDSATGVDNDLVESNVIDLARYRADTRLGQAVWAAMRRFDPAWAEVEWNVTCPALRVQCRDIRIGLRHQGLATLAESAQRKDAVGEAARAALRDLLDRLAGTDEYFYPEVLSAQLQLDPAVARAHWEVKGPSVANKVPNFSRNGTRLARVLADAGWLPPAELDRFQALADDVTIPKAAVDAAYLACIAAAAPPAPESHAGPGAGGER